MGQLVELYERYLCALESVYRVVSFEVSETDFRTAWEHPLWVRSLSRVSSGVLSVQFLGCVPKTPGVHDLWVCFAE